MIAATISILQLSSGGSGSKLDESSPVVIHTQLLVFVSERTQIYLSVKELPVQIFWFLFCLLHSLCKQKFGVWINQGVAFENCTTGEIESLVFSNSTRNFLMLHFKTDLIFSYQFWKVNLFNNIFFVENSKPDTMYEPSWKQETKDNFQ